MKLNKINILFAIFIIIGVILVVWFTYQKESTNSSLQSETIAPSPKLSRYTLSQVQSHSEKNNCWMVVNDGVYDVTTYVDKHPDGLSILDGCGKDATVMFSNIRKHLKPYVLALLEKYRIGEYQK